MLGGCVASGEYARQGDVVRNGLRLLSEEHGLLNDPRVEYWLREVAVPIAKATLADPRVRSRRTRCVHTSPHGATRAVQAGG